MRRNLRVNWFFVCAFAIVAAAGCGGGVKLYPVAGKVTVDGQPLTKGTVDFLAEDPDNRLIPTAAIDEKGNYSVLTSAMRGAPLGKYKVIVRQALAAKSGKEAELDPRTLLAQQLPYHVKFASPTETPLVIEVEATSKPGAYDLNLTKK